MRGDDSGGGRNSLRNMLGWERTLHLDLRTVLRRLTSGRSEPLLAICEETESGERHEVVLKPLGALDSGLKGMAREMICSHLAMFFNLPTPQPAVVHIPEGDLLPSGITEDIRNLFQASGGENFATVHMKEVAPPPFAENLSRKAREMAAEIFAFDLLIQNPDRRVENPNLFWDHSQYIIFDHEQALAFSMILGGSGITPWDFTGATYSKAHFFRRSLSEADLTLDRMMGKLRGCNPDRIDSMMNEVPRAWVTEEMPMIREYLVKAVDFPERFHEAVLQEVRI